MRGAQLSIAAIVLACLCGTALATPHSAKHARGKLPAKAAETKAGTRATLLHTAAFVAGQEAEITFRLAQNGVPVEEKELKAAQALVVSNKLEDFTPAALAPADNPGEFRFHFTPKHAGNYRAWVKFASQFVPLEIPGSVKDSGAPTTKPDFGPRNISGYTFALAFSKTNAFTLNVSLHGFPVEKLEPVQGAFAQLLGFYADGKGVVMASPTGDAPRNLTDRGGPDVAFHLQPPRPGLVKLFARVIIDGEEIFVPFGANVK